MGFSDSLKRISRQIGRLGAKPGYRDRARKGRLKGAGDFLTALGFTQSQEQVEARLGVFAEGNPLKGAERAIRTDLKTAAVSGNIGHLLLRAATREPKGTEPPPVGEAPALGAGTEEAKQEARRRALQRASRRFGFRQTFATSPLGIQGGGAELGKKTLVGE